MESVKTSKSWALKRVWPRLEDLLGTAEHDLPSFNGQLAHFDEGLDEMNNQMQRNNLVVKWLAEKHNKTWNEAEATSSTSVKDKLGIEIG